jgi:hypothetical protein
MQVHRDTVARLVSFPAKEPSGRERLVVVAGYTFQIDPRGLPQVLPDGPDVPLVDSYYGKEGVSSIRMPSQLFDEKPGTDVVLVGHAQPPRGGGSHVDVSLRMGPVSKTVRAHGLRVWQRGAFGGLRPGPARPLREPLPLSYDLAWGGLDLSDPARPKGDARNTCGRGVARDLAALVDQPAAQLEYPDRPVGQGSETPASFGPIHRHWEPRSRFAGTYDQVWMETKMPLLPDDFDARFHICVPEDQWSVSPLRGDEPVEVRGATPEGVWRFQLPRLAPAFASHGAHGRAEHRTHLDGVVIDADAYRVHLFFRAAIPLPRKHQLLESVRVYEKRVL